MPRNCPIIRILTKSQNKIKTKYVLQYEARKVSFHFICVLEVWILLLFLRFLLHFGTVPTVWYFGTVPTSVVFWNCSDSVVFQNCSDSVVFWNCSDSVVFWNCSDSVVFQNCSDSVVFLVFHFIVPIILQKQNLKNTINKTVFVLYYFQNVFNPNIHMFGH